MLLDDLSDLIPHARLTDRPQGPLALIVVRWWPNGRRTLRGYDRGRCKTGLVGEADRKLSDPGLLGQLGGPSRELQPDLAGGLRADLDHGQAHFLTGAREGLDRRLLGGEA